MSQFVVQIVPLIRPDTTITEGDLLIPTQFSDVSVHHILNGFKTAEVTLDMTDPVVAGLEPWEFSLRVLYEDRLEPIFWGPCNIKDNYRTRKCILAAQDPSFRLLHHYLRRGDDALNNIPEKDKGSIFPDYSGIQLVVAAAQNVPSQDARNDPALGIIPSNYGSTSRSTLPIIVERGQECWQVIQSITKHKIGPDIDMETNYTDPNDNYVYLGVYDDLGRDLTEEVILTYGPELTEVQVEPGRSTTHAHVLSSDAKNRRTAGSVAASNKVGPHVDWVPTDLTFPQGNDDALQVLADARVAGYGFAPKFITIQSRPDAVLADNYGHPFFEAPVGTKPSTIYVGDRVTVSAEWGYRSHIGPARITEVHLNQPGPRGPVVTGLKLVPTVGDLGDDEES